MTHLAFALWAVLGSVGIQTDEAARALLALVRETHDEAVCSLELTNLTPVPIVAWTLKIVRPDGRIVYSTEDNHMHLALTPMGPRILLPGQPNSATKRDAQLLRGASVTPIAVVFSDRTALGDEARINAIFAIRRSEALVWDDVLPKLAALQRSESTRQLVEAAAADIADTTGTQPGKAWRRSISNALGSIAQSGRPKEAVQALVSDVTRYAETARFHSIRQ